MHSGPTTVNRRKPKRLVPVRTSAVTRFTGLSALAGVSRCSGAPEFSISGAASAGANYPRCNPASHCGLRLAIVWPSVPNSPPETLLNIELTYRLRCYHPLLQAEVLKWIRSPNHPDSHCKPLLGDRGCCPIWLYDCERAESRRARPQRYVRNDRPPDARCDVRGSWRPLFSCSRVFPGSNTC